jgi:hypothetical protein
MHAHSLIVLSATILLAGAGVILVGLAWQRRYRGEPSGVVLVSGSRARTVASVLVVPVVGILGSVAGLLIVGALQGQFRPL